MRRLNKPREKGSRMKKSSLEKHGETLLIEDFVKFAKECEFKYITAATLYDENGLECKTSLTKSKNKKWIELNKKWKSK